jgi:DNA invertase Pin-like site-specific DNA recombinase
MTVSPKIQGHHLARQAVVYVRQSTPKQVQLNQESTRRQYQLADLAHAWGWPRPLIQTIDDDLGLSGASSHHRAGFQRLIAAISLGEVGLVLVTEISRLSRLNSDWHRVIELCAVFETLIADGDGLYDPREVNDRLLLGLKGTLFSAELHILRARMRDNLLNKARRGELALRLPVGYRRLREGTVVLEPDEQVRHTLHILFEQFSVLKSARAVQRYFLHHQLTMPRLIQCGLDYGRLVWVKPTYQMIQQVLTSPVYAGVFVYGRRKTQTVPGDPPQVHTHRLPLEEWDIAIPDIYPAYISYDQYLLNRQVLRDNQYNFEKKRHGAPREGRGLLQGLLICGRCGRRMTPNYGSKYQSYVCRREQVTYGTSQCQAFPMTYLDQAVGDIFLSAVQPGQLDTMLEALAVLEQERQTLDRQWQLRLDQARYQVRLAQRQYDAVDPDHRLVAYALEKRWNEALLELNQLEQAYAQVQRLELAPLTEAEQQAVRQLAQDLPALWQAQTTTETDRKRLLRLVVREVTLTAHSDTRSADFVILWSGDVVTHHTVTCPPIGWHCVTAATTVQRIRELASVHPDHQIAEMLNAEGIRTQTGKLWTYGRVRSIRKQHTIPTGCPIDPVESAPRGDGLISAKMAAQLLQVSPATVHLWTAQGVLVSDQRITASKLWVRVDDTDLTRLDGSLQCTHLPTIANVMAERQIAREEVWALVRAGRYLAYRVRNGRTWEWRLEKIDLHENLALTQSVVAHEKGITHYG